MLAQLQRRNLPSDFLATLAPSWPLAVGHSADAHPTLCIPGAQATSMKVTVECFAVAIFSSEAFHMGSLWFVEH